MLHAASKARRRGGALDSADFTFVRHAFRTTRRRRCQGEGSPLGQITGPTEGRHGRSLVFQTRTWTQLAISSVIGPSDVVHMGYGPVSDIDQFLELLANHS